MERIELNLEQTTYDFSSQKKVILKFEDDSYTKFNYALVIEAPELKEVGIFTEHCDYHIFNSEGISANIINLTKQT